eukprot:50195-Pelagomonas_calceolata.AAC.4
MNVPCRVGSLGVPVPGTLQSTCGAFQLAELRGESTKVCSKFADVMWSGTCTPCLGVWMREPLVYGLLLIV